MRRLLVCVFGVAFGYVGQKGVEALLIGTQFGDAFGLVVDLGGWGAAFGLGGGIFAPELAQRGLLLRFEGVEAGHFGIDGAFLCAQFGLLLHKPGNHTFVGLIDVAGVLQIALFLAGLGVFRNSITALGWRFL